ncbi:aldehyde dehydrogenase family protein [Metabacillus idriensis]|uniref:aldehyde dehydrogenase family protein n=1 Tax=Metabacillus idriensis TaxID=324768 RepID=UPI0008AA57D3|nr:aldehyde dehydrogenase family protein [Metabacillus idriensis]MCM3598397.1 aldehyde dehydrogenase family protein [Metabacillus idriensis]OHR71542.1 aldehyde dehydrogenase [Bacillus sp. HMSC76G11]
MNNYTKQFINGDWINGASDKTIKNTNPFNGDLINEFNSADEGDLDRAYLAAEHAQKEWGATLPQEKQTVLDKVALALTERKEEIIDMLVHESGSTKVKAEVEWAAALRIVKEASTFPYRMEGKILPSTIPGKENRVYRTAKGVIGVIGPWNFPLHLAMRSVAPALAAGNTVVIKPASEAPITSGFLIGELFEKAGAPKGTVNVVAGRGSEIGDAFIEHQVPKLISFTGSTEVGRHIGELAGKHLKDTALELGGNNVMVVLADADLEKAAESAAFGKFLHQGQICMALNRIIVEESVHEEFVGLFKEKVSMLQAGDPSDAKTAVGPLINHDQIERIQEDLEESLEAGAEKIYGGKIDGNVMHPIILTNVTNDMPIAKNEIFGPVAPILKARDEAEAIKLANGSPYGLSGSVFTKDLHRGVAVAKQIETGMIHVNDQSVNDEAHVAFGGEKDSGLGRFGGEWALDKFTTVKWIGVQEKDRSYPFFN